MEEWNIFLDYNVMLRDDINNSVTLIFFNNYDIKFMIYIKNCSKSQTISYLQQT